MERFVAILIESTAGNFPLWLAPEQIAILPISEKYHDYAQEVHSLMQENDIRGFVDERDEKIGKKIRDAELKKIPYMLIVGEKEAESQTVAVRGHGQGDLGSRSQDDFVAFFKKEIAALVG
jgi:threonyl-tRNA synthetase